MAKNLALATIKATGGSASIAFGDRFAHFKSFEDFGAVGDGTTDDTAAIQAAIDGTADGGVILAYPGKSYSLTSTINIFSRTHLRLIGLPFGNNVVPGAATADSPKFLWNGAANGIMFYLKSCFNPCVWGFNFNSNVAINRYLKCDLTGLSGVTGTAGNVQCNSFINPTANTSFIAVSISETSTTNQENYVVSWNNFQGFGSTSLACRDGVITSGSPNIASASTPFTSGMVGKRARVSYVGGILDTTVLIFTDSGHIVLAANAAANQTGCTVHIDQCYGIGIFSGNSQNAKHHKFDNNVSLHMAIVIQVEGGSFSVNHLNGEGDDIGIMVGYSAIGTATSHMTEPCEINFFESEANLIGVYGTASILTMRNCRIDNSLQQANGFFQLGGFSNFFNCGPVTDTSHETNQIVVARIGGDGGAGNIYSMGNVWADTPAHVGITVWNEYPHGAASWIALDWWDNDHTAVILGKSSDFADLPPNPVLGMETWIDDSSTATWGATISGSGGNLVKAVYNGTNWTVIGK